nr:MAG TPA: hypothetical protein [Caudoviricetes sp.]
MRDLLSYIGKRISRCRFSVLWITHLKIYCTYIVLHVVKLAVFCI